MGHFQNSNIRPASPIVFKSGPPVSVVCVAATYTGVTYANNGGKVQLSSAGVHGLTTSPAVGASVYVSWSGGTGVNGLYKILSVDDTLKITIDLNYAAGLGAPTVAVLNTEIAAISFALPPLAQNSYVRASIVVSITGSTNSRSIYSRLNGTYIGSAGTTSSSNTGGFFIAGFKNSNSQAQQISAANLGGVGFLPTPITTTNIDTSISTTFSIGVKPAAANEFVKIEYCIIEVFI